jgi:UDP-galactopyranose mutase
VHLFPSSIDREHFELARTPIAAPPDQASLPRPRLGYCGVIDERMDLELLERIASERPAWHLVMIGPVTKIDPADLPRRPNIHYLGSRPYAELPAYLAGWDVALLPFALNAATRFISPTKTPEYLAAGRPVVSTPIADVVEPYGRLGLVRIGATHDQYIAAIEAALLQPSPDWLDAVQRFLAGSSWDATWSRMMQLVSAAHGRRPSRPHVTTAHAAAALSRAGGAA